MPKLKITTVSKEFRTAWVEVDDETYTRLYESGGDEVLVWAEGALDGVATEFDEAGEDTAICFVDTESDEALYER